MVSGRGNCPMLLSLQCPFNSGTACPHGPLSGGLAPDVQSSKSLVLVAIDTIVVAVNWNSRSSHTNWVQRPWQEIKKPPGLHKPCFYHIDWDSVYMPPMGIPHRHGDASYLGKGSHLPPQTTRVWQLMDGHDLSQLLLPNQIFRILPLCIETTQGCQKCDMSHRDTRWIGGLSHQSSNLSHLCNLLQKVVICACSDTRFEGIQVVNYLAN